MNQALSKINFARVEAMLERELIEHNRRTPKSIEMLRRGKEVMPSGVPMAWMSGFYETPPMFVDKGEGAYFDDVDGNRYLDMNQADLAVSCGFTPRPVIDAVQQQLERGTAFLLPTEAAIHVAELLRERYGMPRWQFTLAASSANTEAIRLARAATGRSEILMFYGHYHGHWEDVMVESSPNQGDVNYIGLANDAASRAANVPFNDLQQLELALKTKRFACLIAEPALTNCGLVQPDPHYWSQAYALCQQYGSLLVLDEAHTQTFAYGGLRARWSLDCDIYSLGKCLGGGLPLGAYGISEELAQLAEDKIDRYRGGAVLPLGGTLFANALSLTAARAALSEVLTREAYTRVEKLGKQLAYGLNHLFQVNDLPWRAPHLGGRSGYCLSPALPRNSAEAGLSIHYPLIDARRCFMANRGVWEAIASAGPSASFAHCSADIDLYLEVVEAFLDEILHPR